MSYLPNGAVGHLSSSETGDDQPSPLRPYALTGGRTVPSSGHMPLEALVEGIRGPEVGMMSERRAILELTATQYLSVAELSAHLRLPLGVVRVLVSDLADEHLVRVHGLNPTTDDHAASFSVLESVLNGISSL
jgi:Protein of unknown function (DUF742)